MKTNKAVGLYQKAREMIPGGTQLLSKRPEMFLPGSWPAYYDKAKGCTVWSLDQTEYTDMSYMGIGSCILGYADEDVDGAVCNAISKGSMTTLNCPQEVELAEVLCEIHPWAEMVRYARTGGEAMAVAIRIARARTKKDVVLFCGYHGWHDWYLAANLAHEQALDGHLLPGLEPLGVPRALRGTAIPFGYNDTAGFLSLLDKYKGKIAAVVMEPLRNYYPQDGFLETIREMTSKEGITLVFDEITSGWRLCCGGAHLKFGVNPDVCVFAKGMSNGYPMAAVIGTTTVMEAAQETFISSTYWTEAVGPTAALATIKKLKEKHVPDRLIRTGEAIQDGWKKSASKYGLNIKVFGIAPLGHFSFESDKSLVLKTLFTQLMLEKRFLATTAFYASYAHKEEDVRAYLDATDAAFERIGQAVEEGNPEEHLKGPVCHAGFKRLT